MKTIITLVVATFLFFTNTISAQDTVENGGFEFWRLKEFKCCGRNIDQPWYWGITEQLTGLNYNKFTFRMFEDSNVHSGSCAMQLFSDTTYLNNLVLIPGTVAYGGLVDSASTAVTIGPVIQAAGVPISSNPYSLNFYMKMNHQVTDTPYYMYLFTRWNSAQQGEDTLAYAMKDIPDNIENMYQWVLYSDTIHYTLPGTPDTVRLLFFGGRFGDARRQGNSTCLDDITFYYPTTGLVNLNGDPVLQVYPNPASNLITIKTGQYNPGNIFSIFDVDGRFIKAATIESYLTSLDINELEAGNYFYSLTSKGHALLTKGRFTVVK